MSLPIWQTFEFGRQKPTKTSRGEDTTRGDFKLDVSSSVCSWSINRRGVQVIGSGDHRNKRRFYDRMTPPRDRKEREAWIAATEFFESVKAGSIVVKRVVARRDGSLTISMSDSYVLSVLPCAKPYDDYWYFLNRKTDKSIMVGATEVTYFYRGKPG